MLDDRQIDDVAKAMTSTPAGERLAERVAARIAHARTPRAWPWVMVPIAAAAVLIVVASIVRLKPDTTRNATTTMTSRGSDITVASTPAPAPTLAPVVTPTRIPTIDRIHIDSIAVQPLVETNAIQITPIAIDRIEIAAMP